LTSTGKLSISAAMALSSADSPGSESGLFESAAASPSMLNLSGCTETSQINNPPAHNTASGAQTDGCVQWRNRAIRLLPSERGDLKLFFLVYHINLHDFCYPGVSAILSSASFANGLLIESCEKYNSRSKNQQGSCNIAPEKCN
jgi:hypothetical protein